MVLKLIKHEFRYLGRYLLLIWAGIILMMAMQRILTGFHHSENPAMQIVVSGAGTLLVFSVIAMFFITFGAIVMRFYQNMFTGEGYLTFTLPVKISQIIFAKLLTGAVFMAVPFVTTILLLASYIPDSITWYVLYSAFLDFIEQFDLPVYIMVILGITILLTPIMQLLEFYLAMSLGQLANRNKIIFSIIAYIGIHSVKQAIGVIIWLIFLFSGITDKMNIMLEEAFSFTIIVGFMASIMFITVDWFLINYLCKNKLNLE